MKFIKALLAGVLAFSLAACTTKDNQQEVVLEPIKVLAPLGAPSVSLLGLADDENVTIDTVDGANVLSAELTKADSEYDVIIAPINLGAGMISKGKSSYLLDQVVTWGNLYVIGTSEDALSTEGMFAAFGEKAVPQKILTASLDMATIVPEVTYFASVNEVQQQLLSKKATAGLIAEPAATATMKKAKEKGIELQILKDLQKEYQLKNGTETAGYPQAALFVKEGSQEKVKPYIEKAADFANKTAKEDVEAVKAAIELLTPQKLGIPNAEIVVKTWDRQNIHFVKANEAKDDIATFLKQFQLTLEDNAYNN